MEQNITLISKFKQIKPNTLIILSGSNGSGKSTTIKTIAGILSPLKGTISINMEDIRSQSNARLAMHLAYASTERIYEDYISIYEMVRFGNYPYSGGLNTETPSESVNRAISLMKIEHIKDKYLNEVSDGEWQKANIARVLAQDTPILLMDEPSAFLDYPSRMQLFKDLSEFCNDFNKSILISTHDIEIANKYGNLFWHIEKKQLFVSKNPPVWNF
ncbi:MAG: ABC transporter ATP-binding protein [Bacteroidia bacterium]